MIVRAYDNRRQFYALLFCLNFGDTKVCLSLFRVNALMKISWLEVRKWIFFSCKVEEKSGETAYCFDWLKFFLKSWGLFSLVGSSTKIKKLEIKLQNQFLRYIFENWKFYHLSINNVLKRWYGTPSAIDQVFWYELTYVNTSIRYFIWIIPLL